MAELIWAPSALADIDNIANYIAHDSVQGAKTQVAAFSTRQKCWKHFLKLADLFLN